MKINLSRLKYVARYSVMRDQPLENGNVISGLVPLFNVHFGVYKKNYREELETKAIDGWTDSVVIIVRHNDKLKVDADHSFIIGKPFNDKPTSYDLLDVKPDYGLGGFDLVTLTRKAGK